MGLVITKQEEIDAYYESDRLNQSSLKALIKGMDNFLSNQSKQNESAEAPTPEHFLHGGGVDTILTGEDGQYEEKYYVSQIEKKPTEAELAILNTTWEDVQNLYSPVELGMENFEFKTLDQYPGTLNEAISQHGWYNGKPGEKRIAGLIERGTEYFEDLKRSHGKQILSSEQDMVISNVVMSLKTNPRTAKYFDRESQMRNTHVDYYYQLPIYFEYEGIECKALLDLVIVVKDETGRIVSVQPIDLKTMSGPTLTFPTSLRSLRYDIQAAWYNYAVKIWMAMMGHMTDDYKLHNFMFIVESTTQPGTPLIFDCTDSLLEIGMLGREKVYSGPIRIANKIKGFANLVDDYHYYEQIEWKEEKVIQENDGVLQLEWNGVIE